MSAPLPYHFCVIIGCDEMIPPGPSMFCAEHCMTEFGDGFFPGAEALVCPKQLSPDASQETNTNESCRVQHPVTGDAGIQKESQP